MRAQDDTPEAQAALGELCEIYWLPVFRFLQRDGRSEDSARELTQEFFALLLSRDGVLKVDRGLGRFRSYLLGALKHFLSNLKRSEGRQKRGGDVIQESIDATPVANTSSEIQVPDPRAQVPDSFFDRQWALAVMERALNAVGAEFKTGGKEQQFEVLKPWLIGETENLSQAEAARQLGMTEGALKVAIHRLRKNFRAAVQSEISQTVTSPDEVASELRYLIEALS